MQAERMSDSMYMHVHTPATAYLHVCSARVHAHVSHTQPVAHPLLQTPFSSISGINHSRDWLGDRLSQSRRQMWVWRKRRDSSKCLVSPIYCWLEGKSSIPPLIQNMRDVGERQTAWDTCSLPCKEAGRMEHRLDLGTWTVSAGLQSPQQIPGKGKCGPKELSWGLRWVSLSQKQLSK